MIRVRSVIISPWTWAIALIAVSVMCGIRLQDESPEVFLGAAPLVGRNPTDGWDWRFGWGLVGAGVIALGVITATATGWWWRISTRVLVAVASISAAAFAVLLALTDGTDGLLHGATDRTEYLANLAVAPPTGEFVRGFVGDIDSYSVHVRGHPPGFVVLLQSLDSVGLGGAWPTVAISILATMLLPAAVLVTVWRVAGVEWVRRCAPLLIVAPYALWMTTSADAFYTAVGACGVATCAFGLHSTRWRSACWGATSGLLLGSLLFLTYGGTMFLLVPLVPAILAASRSRPGALPTIVAAVLGAAAVTAAFAVAGFWWFEGATETRRQYWAGTAQFRPFAYFAIANLSATLIAIGPSSFGGLVRIVRQRRNPPPIAALVVGGALALLASHLSQYSRAEVERIWLLFFPWLAIAGGTLMARTERRRATAAVSVQAIGALVLQAALVSKW